MVILTWLFSFSCRKVNKKHCLNNATNLEHAVFDHGPVLEAPDRGRPVVHLRGEHLEVTLVDDMVQSVCYHPHTVVRQTGSTLGFSDQLVTEYWSVSGQLVTR